MTDFLRIHVLFQLRALIVATLVLAAGASHLAAAPIVLKAGQTHDYSLKQTAERIHIRQGGIVDLFMPNAKTLSIHGLRSGGTALDIEYVNDQIERLSVLVTPEQLSDAQTVKAYLQQQLKGVGKLEFTVKKASDPTARDKVVISGQADTRYKGLIAQVSGLFPEMIESQVEYDNATVAETELFLKKALASFPDVKLALTGKDKIEITGRIEREGYAYYRKIIGPFSDVVVDKVTSYVSKEDAAKKQGLYSPMVQIDVEVVEVSLNKVRQLGVNWFDDSNTVGLNATLTGSGDPFNFTYSSSLAAENLRVRLQALANDGDASILANPRLKVRSGEQASFVVGGEVPIVSVTANTSSVQYKNFGTQLKITPEVEGKKDISVHLNATVSTLNFANAVNGNPGIDKKEAETTLTIKDGESFALAGLIERQEGESESRIPLLGDIPLLGGLFTRSNKSVIETETLIIVTPHILKDGKPDHMMTERMTDTRRNLKDRVGNLHRGPFGEGADRDFYREGGSEQDPLHDKMQKALEDSSALEEELDKSERPSFNHRGIR